MCRPPREGLQRLPIFTKNSTNPKSSSSCFSMPIGNENDERARATVRRARARRVAALVAVAGACLYAPDTFAASAALSIAAPAENAVVRGGADVMAVVPGNPSSVTATVGGTSVTLTKDPSRPDTYVGRMSLAAVRSGGYDL